MHIRLLLALLVGLLILPLSAQEDSVTTTRDTAPSASVFQTITVMNGLSRPLFLTHAGDDSGRLFLVQQGGVIYVVDGETYEQRVFLDVSNLVTSSANGGGYTEQGLLGLAFHPKYSENGMFFIYYTDASGNTAIARYRVSDDASVADAASGEIFFTHPQPFGNHNGGHMAFGADGYLYVSLGDGGAANDPLGSGQNPTTLLGSILRLNVDAETDYTIPEDNPFVGSDAGADEVWSYGLRNVWRFSFDSATGDIYIGDVGQNQYEEINFEPADSPGGVNYGWNAFEASTVFNQNVSAENAVMPVAEYNHSEGCSITAGYIYRGDAIPELQATYLYSDYCTGRVWYAYRDVDESWQYDTLFETGNQVSSFGEDESGELYIIDYSGAVMKIVPTE
ncbi:MAG: PQQ-dependent sugar dehydrogenase [Aggregatilineales bacterium]